MDLKNVRKGELEFMCRNEAELQAIYEEVFERGEYAIEQLGEAPEILDCGSHIGVSVAYFKTMYPRARVIAFEPSPWSFELLRMNVERNHFEGVELVNAAVSDRHGSATLFTSREKPQPWTWGDSLIRDLWDDAPTQNEAEVRTVPLASYVTNVVDLLKLNVEGLEEKVLLGIEPVIRLVRHLVIEYHGPRKVRGENDLGRILALLTRHGFSVDTWPLLGADPEQQCYVRARWLGPPHTPGKAPNDGELR